MLKKLASPFFLFLAGLVVAVMVGRNFQQLIKGLFRNLTDQKIQFRDSIIQTQLPWYVYVGFAFGLMLFCILKFRMDRRLVILFVMLEVILFYFSIVGISYMSAKVMLAVCTNCGDHVLWIYDDAINYAFVIITSAGIAVLPSVVYQLIQRRKRRKLHETNVIVEPDVNRSL
jgi:hypothetical protein